MSIKNDGHYFCRAGGNRPDGLNEPVTVQANLAYQSCRDSGALFKVLHQVNNELHDLLDSLENHTPLVRKNADELIALLLLFTRQVGQSRTDLI